MIKFTSCGGRPVWIMPQNIIAMEVVQIGRTTSDGLVPGGFEEPMTRLKGPGVDWFVKENPQQVLGLLAAVNKQSEQRVVDLHRKITGEEDWNVRYDNETD